MSAPPPPPAGVDAAVRLIRSLTPYPSQSGLGDDDNGDDYNDDGGTGGVVVGGPSPSSLLPLARRILSSGIASSAGGGGGFSASSLSGAAGGASPADLSSSRRRLERSLKSSHGNRRQTNKVDGDDPVARHHADRTTARTLAKVDSLHRQLGEAEERHWSLYDDGGGGGGGGVTDGVVVALSRLAGTKQDVAPRGIAADLGGLQQRRPTGGAAYSAPAAPAPAAPAPTAQPTTSGKGISSISPEVRSILHEESMLLRDCLYALQCVDSERIKFYYYHRHRNNPPNEPTAGAAGLSSVNKHDAALRCDGLRVDPSSTTLLLQPPSTNTMMDMRHNRLLGSGASDALRICGEAGWLYGRVETYVEGVRGGNGGGGGVGNGGAVSRALASALSEELSEYHRLIAVLEAQLGWEYNRSVGMEGGGDGSGSRSGGNSGSGGLRSGGGGSGSSDGGRLTLRRLLLHLRPATVRLRTLATLTDSLLRQRHAAQQLGPGGGALISILHSHSVHGSSTHSALMHSLTARAAVPWFDMLWGWTMDGTLPPESAYVTGDDDRAATVVLGGQTLSQQQQQQQQQRRRQQQNEFFVGEDLSVPDSDLWHGRYVLWANAVPACSPGEDGGGGGVLGMDLAKLALVVGKGINFIRRCLGDARWEVDLDGLLTGGPIGDGSGGGGSNNQSDRSASVLRGRLGYRYVPPSSPGSGAGPAATSPNTSSTLSETLAGIAAQVNSHILQSLNERHHLSTHLWALKQFLLLGRGDFVNALLDGLHRELDARGPGPDGGNDDDDDDDDDGATTRRRRRRVVVGTGEMDGVYVHTLMGVLENALRSTNARYLPSYVLGRLRVELDDGDVQVQRRGREHNRQEDPKRAPPSSSPAPMDAWDAFSLAYDIDAPLTAIVHPRAMSQYERVFRLLFRLERIVYMLNRTWRQSTSLHHALRQLEAEFPAAAAAAAAAAAGGDNDSTAAEDASEGGEESSSSSSRERTAHLLRKVCLTRQSILHFASNLQSYLMFDVIEGGYKDMVGRVAGAKTLDEVIAAHDLYLDEIVQKSLFDCEEDHDDSAEKTPVGHDDEGTQDQRAPEQEHDSLPPKPPPSLGSHLAEVMDVSLRFCHVHSDMFATALRSVDVASRKRRVAERRAKSGQWGYDEVDEDVDGTKLFGSLSDVKQMREVERIGDEFDGALKALLSALDRELNDAPPVVPITSLEANVASAMTPESSYIGAGWGGAPMVQRHYHSLNQANNDSLRFLAFRLDFNEYYNKGGNNSNVGGG